jgi:hypothetical protein
MSLLSEAIGFSVLGILIILNRHQADLNGLSGGSSIAMIGGISAILVGTVFLVAAGLHWRFCARHPAELLVRCPTARFTFARPNPVTAIALLSS